MSEERPRSGADVRMNVKVSRRDFPVLADEISRLPKGKRRTNRLAHLATMGLIWERVISEIETAPSDSDLGRCGETMPRSAARGYVSRLPDDLVTALIDDECAS